MGIKNYFKKHPIISTIVTIIIILAVIYGIFLLILLRPLNMINGRNHSYGRPWKYIVANIDRVKVGDTDTEVLKILGSPDEKDKIESSDEVVWNYEEYSIIAANWIYAVKIHNHKVIKVDKYTF